MLCLCLAITNKNCRTPSSKKFKKSLGENMKFVLSFLVICSSFWSIQLQANYLTDIEQIIQDIKTNDISLEQILMLMDLDEADSSIGYALCVESGEQYYNCHSGANLAYGLCVVSGEQYYNCAD